MMFNNTSFFAAQNAINSANLAMNSARRAMNSDNNHGDDSYKWFERILIVAMVSMMIGLVMFVYIALSDTFKSDAFTDASPVATTVVDSRNSYAVSAYTKDVVPVDVELMLDDNWSDNSTAQEHLVKAVKDVMSEVVAINVLSERATIEDRIKGAYVQSHGSLLGAVGIEDINFPASFYERVERAVIEGGTI